jgi:hypothetical protein
MAAAAVATAAEAEEAEAATTGEKKCSASALVFLAFTHFRTLSCRATASRRPGDWDCPQCRNLVRALSLSRGVEAHVPLAQCYASKTACNRCGTPKPGGGGGGGGYSGCV